MENIRRFFGFLGLLVQYPFFQLKHKIIEWFQSLRGTKPEISNDEMPSMQDGPASRTRSTSTPPPEYDRAGFKSKSKNFALKHFGLYPEGKEEQNEENSSESGSEEEHLNQSGSSDENNLNEEPKEEKI